MKFQLLRLIRFSALAMLLMAVTGCGDGQTASISGTAECDGTPLPDGWVVFSSEATTCSGKISNGEFEVFCSGSRSVPLETYAVKVVPPENKAEYNPDTDSEEIVPGTSDLSLFPTKYQDTTTSGLTFTPEAGSNTFVITLTKDAE